MWTHYVGLFTAVPKTSAKQPETFFNSGYQTLVHSSPALYPCATSLGTRESVFLDSLLERASWQWELVEEWPFASWQTRSRVQLPHTSCGLLPAARIHLSQFLISSQIAPTNEDKLFHQEPTENMMCEIHTKANLLGVSYPGVLLSVEQSSQVSGSSWHYCCLTTRMLV